MVLAMYLELNSPRKRRDATVHPQIATYAAHPTASSGRSLYSTANVVYNNSVPPLPEAQPLSSAIEGYMRWMTCQGIEVPAVDFSSSPTSAAREASSEWSKQIAPSRPPITSKPKKHIPNGILHPSRIFKPRALGKNVRWRDYEQNKHSMGFSALCGGQSALIEVYDESMKDMASVPFNRSPTPRSTNDPILSYHEKALPRQHQTQTDHYDAIMNNTASPPLTRAPSPHPRAQINSGPFPMRRSPSPHHASKMHQQNQQASPRDGRQVSRGRSFSPDPDRMCLPRVRSQSPLPVPVRVMPRVRNQSPLPVTVQGRMLHVRSQSPRQGPVQGRMPLVRSQSPMQVPVRGQSPNPTRTRQGTPQRNVQTQPQGRRLASPAPTDLRRGTPQRSGTPQQREPTERRGAPQQRLSTPQRASSQQRGSSQPRGTKPQRDSRQAKNKHKRFAEPPGKEGTRFTGLPGKEEIRELPGKKESQFAEIVWKSKDEPKEEKKKGWSLIRRSGSFRSKPQPESPQYRRTGPEEDQRWISKNNSSMSDAYDRYNTL